MRADSTASGVNPSIRTILLRPFSPATSVTHPRETPSAFARNRTSASFAFPSTGGAFSRIRRTPSS
jgi:hypothetical protein